jgi:hypothetical protein
MKPRNYELAVILRNDPARLRTRTVETERRKNAWKRAAREQG